MKTLFKTLIGIAFVLTMNASFAQTDVKDKKTPQEKAQMMTERMNKQLFLSESQKSKIYDLNLGVVQKNEVIRNNVKLTQAQKKESIQNNMKARNEVLKTLLTPEQIKVMEDHEKLRQDKNELRKKNEASPEMK